MEFLQSPYVIMDGCSYLDDLVIREEVAQSSVHSEIVYSEKKRLFCAGKLQQSHTIAWLRGAETRTCLSVETYDLLRTQVCDRLLNSDPTESIT